MNGETKRYVLPVAHDSFTIPPFCFLPLKEQVNSAFACLALVTTHERDTCIASLASCDCIEYRSPLYLKEVSL